MTLVGNAGDDTLLGGQAPDLLLGGAGEDELYAVTPRDYGFPSPRLPRGVVVGLDTLYAARGDDTLVGDGADDGFHGEPRALDDMWINLHDGTLRIRATPGHRLDLKLASSEGLPVLSPSIYDYDFNAVLCGDRLLRDVRSIEVMGGMTPADVSFDEGFAATGIPVCFVTEWSHKQAAAPVEAPAAPSAGAEVATVAAPSPSPAPAGAFAANPLLVTDSKVWDL
jgi:hypothetical protein